MLKKIFKITLKPLIITFTKIGSIKYEPRLFSIINPKSFLSLLISWKTRISRFYLRSPARDIYRKAAKRQNLFLISLSITLIYIILSLKGADAGNSFLLIIGLLGFLSLITTPILIVSFFLNSGYDSSNIVKSILPDTKSSKVNTNPSNPPEANEASVNNQSDQIVNNRNNHRKKNRRKRRKLALKNKSNNKSKLKTKLDNV